MNCKLKTLYDHENLYCIESIIIVNQIKVFKLNSLTLFENKKAFTMSSLLDKLCSLLPEGLSTKYSTAKLQTRLQNHYGDTIVIESQKGQGQSNIVFSNSISVADAIRAASKLKADLKFSEVEASFVDVPDMQEDQILHDAANVLRGSLHAVEISKDFYPSPSDLSHHR